MALALVQSAGGSGTTTATATLPAPVTAGNAIVAIVGGQGPAGWSFGITGGLTGFAGKTNAATTLGVYQGTKFPAVGGEQAFTATNGAGTTTALQLEVFEVSGWVSGTILIDTSPAGQDNGSGTATPSLATGTMAQASELVIAGVMCAGTVATESWTNSFNSVSHSTNQLLAAYFLTSSTASVSTVASWTTARASVAIIVSFKQGDVTVDSDTDLRWGVNGTVDSDTDLRWGVNGTVDSDTDLRWTTAGPVGPFSLRSEADWSGDPLTRPADGSYSSLAAVSDGISSLDTKRGTKILAAGLETGTSSKRVDNSGRALDPSNTASSLYPNVKPRKRMRDVVTVSGTDYRLHTGFAERFPIDWSRALGYCNITTQDLLGLTATATLPWSVLDIVTRSYNPIALWPMSETSGTFADDVVGTYDGTYSLPISSTGSLTAYDPRSAVVFGRPTGDTNVSQNMVVTGISVGQAITFSGWFKWNPVNEVTTQPTVLMLQDSTSPSTFAGSTGIRTILVSVRHVASTSLDQGKLQVLTQDTAGFNFKRGLVDFNLLDGLPHHIMVSIDAATKTVTGWVDGLTAGLSDVAGVGSVAISSIDVSGVLSHARLFAAGWGIVWDSASATQNSAAVGQAALFNSILGPSESTAIYDAGRLAWNGDLTGARLNRILDQVGIAAGDRNIDTGTQTCGPTILGQQTAKQYIAKLLATELGELFVNGDGKIRFIQRQATYGTPVQVFSDNPTADASLIPGVPVCPYQPVVPDYSYDRIVNDVVVSRENGADQEVIDQTSIDDYGQVAGTKYRTGQAGPVGKLDTLHQTATAARASAQWLIDRHKNPVTYIQAVTVEAIDRQVSLSTMVGIEIGDTVVIRARPAGGGSPISLIALVEAVQHRFTDDGRWTVTYSLTDGTTYP